MVRAAAAVFAKQGHPVSNVPRRNTQSSPRAAGLEETIG